MIQSFERIVYLVMLSNDTIMAYKPPYTLSSTMIKMVADITRLIGQLEGYKLLSGNLKLRRINKVKSVLSSLAIEGNTLTEGEVTAILDGKPVFGPPNEILEVQNALRVYDQMDAWKYSAEGDLLDAHRILMRGLIPSAGKYRQGGVGVVDGSKVIHVAPPFNRVPYLMGDLFDYLNNYDEETIIQSCVFHYEFEFIHPFSDGNGRMGRLWQTMVLMSKFPVMRYVPFETIVHQRQQGYYKALADSQSVGNSDPFIYFMLDALKTALEAETARTNVVSDFTTRMRAFEENIRQQSFNRKDYMSFHKDLSPASASRDLRRATEERLLIKSGNGRTTTYQFAKTDGPSGKEKRP